MDTKTKITQKVDMVKRDGYGKIIVPVQDHKIVYIGHSLLSPCSCLQDGGAL